MRDEEKPYVCVRNGWLVQIAPRNAEGWKGLGLWLLALMLPTGGFVALIATEPGPVAVVVLTILFLLVLAIWAVAMIRWMMARGQIVDVEDLASFKRDQRRGRSRD